MTKMQAQQLNGLQLAYMGDTVCDLIARTQMMFTDKPVKAMHACATGLVNARAQAQQLARIMHLLDEDEHDVVRRAANAHPGHGVPQAATREEYQQATAYEALMGYLFLTGQMRRAQMLFELGQIKE